MVKSWWLLTAIAERWRGRPWIWPPPQREAALASVPSEPVTCPFHHLVARRLRRSRFAISRSRLLFNETGRGETLGPTLARRSVRTTTVRAWHAAVGAFIETQSSSRDTRHSNRGVRSRGIRRGVRFDRGVRSSLTPLVVGRSVSPFGKWQYVATLHVGSGPRGAMLRSRRSPGTSGNQAITGTVSEGRSRHDATRVHLRQLGYRQQRPVLTTAVRPHRRPLQSATPMGR